MSKDEQLGEAAYNAYCDAVDWKSVKGEKLPKWSDQSSELQEGWITAAQAVVKLNSSFGEPK